MAFKIRVSRGIILVNTLLIMITGFTIIFFSWMSSQGSASSLAASLMQEMGESVKNKIVMFFSPSERAAREIGYLVHSQVLDPVKRQDETLEYFKELLKVNPEFKMVYFADTKGNLIMNRRMPDGSFTRRFVNRNDDHIKISWEHENASYYGTFANTTEALDSGYDPRKRPWYIDASKNRELTWTKVYIFATDRQPGFTCAFPLFDADGALQGVCAVDIAVSELSLFLGKMSPTPGSRIFILDSQDSLVAFQAKTALELEKLFKKSTDGKGQVSYDVVSVDEGTFPEMAAIIKEEKNRGEGQQFTLATKEGKLVSMITPALTDRGLRLKVGIYVPEQDILGKAMASANFTIMFSLVMIVLAFIASIFLSRSIANPMRQLSEEMNKIKDFVLETHKLPDTFIREVNDMQGSFESMKNGLKSFKRYVPADLVASLVKGGHEANVGGEKRELTIFFSDIAKFTTISESMTPEALVADLCEYFNVISKTIIDNQGQVDKFIGDSVMAFWGAPAKLENHAYLCCKSAIEARDKLHAMFRIWENNNKHQFHTRIGIHTGEVIVGNIGYAERLNYTVIGDSVNVASRLEGMNKVYSTDILVSALTYEQVKEHFEFRMLDRVAVLGRSESFAIYELLSFKDNITANLKKIYNMYETGLQFYFEANWAEAIRHFNTVLKYRPHDMPSKVMLKRCKLYEQNPPADGWNGVFMQSSK